MSKRIGDLELDQDLSYQQREWQVERIGWIICLVILLAAMLGILGSGPLSQTTAGSQEDSLWIDYDRFVRRRSPTELVVYVDPGAIQEAAIQLQFDQAFAKKAQIQRIDPQPEQEQIAAGQIIYTFRAGEGNVPLQILYYIELESYGPHTIPVSLAGGPAIEVNQLVYP